MSALSEFENRKYLPPMLQPTRQPMQIMLS